MFRSYSDVESGRITTSPRMNLEANCNQIFARGPTITKDILEKLQNDVAPKRAIICGYEIYTKQISVLIALFVLFMGGLFLTCTMWGTNYYRDQIVAEMIVLNNTKSYETWRDPGSSYNKVYLFNYTNVEAYEAGYVDKLNVEEIGPFVYREDVIRENINFNEDETVVSFQDRRTFTFMPELSNGRKQFDKITVPNLPMFGAAAMVKDSFYLTKLAMSGVFRSLNAKPFITLPADRFIFGYDDDLYSLAKGVLALSQPLPFEKFGILAGRNGLSKDVIEMYTGKGDISKLGLVKSVNTKTEYKHWLHEDCNRMEAADSFYYPPLEIQAKKPIKFLYKEICRPTTFKFDKVVRILNGTVPVYRYVVPEDVYSHPNMGNSENQCFCDMDAECPPHGLFNATKCSFGTPIFISQPHFKNADPALRDALTGLKNPGPEEYQSYFDVHPYLGFATQGWSRIQMNVHVKKAFGMTQLSMFNEDIYLPISWMDVGIDAKDASDEVRQQFYDATYIVKNLEIALKYGSALMTLVTFIGMLIIIRGNYFRNNKLALERSNSGESRLLR